MMNDVLNHFYLFLGSDLSVEEVTRFYSKQNQKNLGGVCNGNHRINLLQPFLKIFFHTKSSKRPKNLHSVEKQASVCTRLCAAGASGNATEPPTASAVASAAASRHRVPCRHAARIPDLPSGLPLRSPLGDAKRVTEFPCFSFLVCKTGITTVSHRVTVRSFVHNSFIRTCARYRVNERLPGGGQVGAGQ